MMSLILLRNPSLLMKKRMCQQD